jgi:hypothetical protein
MLVLRQTRRPTKSTRLRGSRGPPTESTSSAFSVLSMSSYVVCSATTHCEKCGGLYTSIASHRALCLRDKVTCVFRDPDSEHGVKTIVLKRINGHFKCIYCGKLIKKDDNMKVSSLGSSSKSLRASLMSDSRSKMHGWGEAGL